MSLTYSWTSRRAALVHSCSFDFTSATAPDQPQIAVLQLLDAIAQRGGLLELQIRRGRLHLRAQSRDVRLQLAVCLEQSRVVRGLADGDVVALVHARHHIVDALDDGRRGDAVFAVVLLLDL